jgi:hypothetical protein
MYNSLYGGIKVYYTMLVNNLVYTYSGCNIVCKYAVVGIVPGGSDESGMYGGV